MTDRPSRTLPVISLALAIALSACGGGTNATDPASAPSIDPPASTAQPASAAPSSDGGGEADACAMLSDEDIVELTGFEVDTMEPGAAMGVYEDGCHWTLAGGSTAGMGIPAEITLGVVSPGGRSYFDTYIAPYAEDYGQEPLQGVGDVGLTGGLVGTATAVEGDFLADLQWSDFDGDDSVAIALLERVLANAGG